MQNKSLTLAEFSIQNVNLLTQRAEPCFFDQSEDVANLLRVIATVIESKKPRLVKHATPILQTCQKKMPDFPTRLAHALTDPEESK